MSGGWLLAGLLLPLAIDTVLVSAALGSAGLAGRARLRVSLVMTGFEMVMPIVGLAIGAWAGPIFTAGLAGWGDYLAAAVLGVLGLHILFGHESEASDESTRIRAMAAAGVGTLVAIGLSVSLDELGMGLSIGLLRLPVAPAIVIIGIQAFIASQLGLRLGARLSERVRESAERGLGVMFLALAGALVLLRLLGIR